MKNIPKFIEGSKVLISPLDGKGNPTVISSILATLLNNKPLTKLEILSKVELDYADKTKGFLSNHFAELRRTKILDFDSRVCCRKWSQGENYQLYLGYVFMEILQKDESAIDSLAYRLMPKEKEQSMDFIKGPEEDIFSQPNSFLED